MKQPKIILLMLILATFTSCKHDDVVCTLKGRILTNCNETPFANQSIALKQELSSGLTVQGGLLAETTTDADGNFMFTYKDENGEPLSINCSGPMIEGIPVRENLDIGTIISNPICIIIYRVKINKPYNIGDTLSCFNFDNPGRSIFVTGPFQDTTFGLFNAYSIIPVNYQTRNESTIEGNWFVKNGSFYTSLKRVEIQVQNCNTVPDTLTMVID